MSGIKRSIGTAQKQAATLRQIDAITIVATMKAKQLTGKPRVIRNLALLGIMRDGMLRASEARLRLATSLT